MEQIDLLKRCEQNAHYNIYGYLVYKYYEQMQLLLTSNDKKKEKETIIILNFIQSEIKKIKEKIDHDEKTEA